MSIRWFIVLILFSGCSKQRSDSAVELYEARKHVVIHVLSGDVDLVSKAVQANPALISARDSWDQSTLLHAACTNVQREPMVQALLKLGFDPNARNNLGQTPLHLAVMFDADRTIVDALIDAGAEPELIDAKGNTPFDYRNDNS